MRAARAVELTKSENTLGAAEEAVASTAGGLAPASERRTAMARFSRRPRRASAGHHDRQALHTVSKRSDAELLQVLVRQTRENRLVNVVLAEGRLIRPRPSFRSQSPRSIASVALSRSAW